MVVKWCKLNLDQPNCPSFEGHLSWGIRGQKIIYLVIGWIWTLHPNLHTNKRQTWLHYPSVLSGITKMTAPLAVFVTVTPRSAGVTSRLVCNLQQQRSSAAFKCRSSVCMSTHCWPGAYRSWKVMEIKFPIFQAWKVMESCPSHGKSWNIKQMVVAFWLIVLVFGLICIINSAKSNLVLCGPIHERAYDRNRAYDGRTPNLRRRGLFTKPVIRTTFVKLS